MELSTAASIITKLDLPWHQLYDVKVDLKRDELIHPFISGNKWRKLKYNLIEARHRSLSKLVTFGGAFSNHLLATACACASFSIKSYGIVRGEEAIESNHVLALCRLFGMELHFISREQYREKEAFARENFSETEFYHVPEGGSNEFAVKGVQELFNELNSSYDFIYTACGSGGTTAGLLHGVNLWKLDSRVRAVTVLKEGAHLIPVIQKLTPNIEKLDMVTDYHFGGYAKCTAELMHFLKGFATDTGILLDPVYTGKMMYALKDQIGNGRVPRGSKVLAIHTGGLSGLLTERYLKILNS